MSDELSFVIFVNHLYTTNLIFTGTLYMLHNFVRPRKIYITWDIAVGIIMGKQIHTQFF